MTPIAAEFDAASSPAPGSAGLAGEPPLISPTDGERLLRFRQHRDEAAFHDVVRAHAPLVWGICWQVLRHREDVEDAFQATFLILARNAASIRSADSAAGWLYRVAFRTALAARQRRRRLGIEPLADDPPGPLEEQLAAIERSEQCEALLEELHALAARYREPLVLCYLEGRSRQEAADELGVTLASIKGRLARGLRLLRTRMGYRGLSLSSAAALLTSELAATSASALGAPIAETAALGASFAWATSTVGVESSTAAGSAAGVITLAKKGILAMKIAAAAKPAIGLLAVGMTAGALALASADQSAVEGDGRATAVVELVASDDALGASEDGAALAPNTFVAAAAAFAAPAEVAAPSLAAVPAPAAVTEPTPMAAPAMAPAEGIAPVATVNPVAAAPAVAGHNPYASPTPTPVVQPTIGVYPPPATMATTSALGGVDIQTMELEMEYWEIKEDGLEKKGQALRMRATALAKAQAPAVEVLELEAEAYLTYAEVALCQVRQRQMKEAINQLERQQRTAAPTLSATPTLAYPAATTPAYAPQPAASAPTLATPFLFPTHPYAIPRPQAATEAMNASEAAQIEARRAQIERVRAEIASLQEQLEHLETQPPTRP